MYQLPRRMHIRPLRIVFTTDVYSQGGELFLCKSCPRGASNVFRPSIICSTLYTSIPCRVRGHERPRRTTAVHAGLPSAQMYGVSTWLHRRGRYAFQVCVYDVRYLAHSDIVDRLDVRRARTPTATTACPTRNYGPLANHVSYMMR